MIIDSSRAAAELLAPFFAAHEDEVVAVIHLDGGRRLLATTFGEAGEEDSVDLHIRDILGSALRLGADSLIVAHNHPSGDAEPREEDLRATRRLADAAAGAGIRLTDHLIFSGDDCRSFRELNLM